MLLHPINENDDKKIKTTEIEEIIKIEEESKEESKVIKIVENYNKDKSENKSEDDDSIDLDKI
jgi:hypothetical protein